MAEQPDRDQKTEDATPRRRQEAREKGQVAYSTEAVTASTLIAWVGIMLLAGGTLANSSGQVLAEMLDSLAVLGTGTMDIDSATELAHELGHGMLADLAVFVLPVLALVLALGFGQVGFKIAPKALSIDPARINPIKGIGRLFSKRTVVRTLLAMLKIALILTTIVTVAYGQFERIVSMDLVELGPALQDARTVAVRCVLAALVAITVLAAVDFAFQRTQHERDLRMSKQEIKDEHKQSEGDPQLRSRIRQVQREMAMRRMMQDVPSATVVVTNPTHFAVALRYERDDHAGTRAASFAPLVVAKGVELVAQRIKQVAREAGVPIYEDVPLARALHAQCEIGDPIPFDLYQAVAGVLAYVYRVQGDRPVAEESR